MQSETSAFAKSASNASTLDFASLKDRRHGTSNSKRIAIHVRHRCRGLAVQPCYFNRQWTDLRPAWPRRPAAKPGHRCSPRRNDQLAGTRADATRTELSRPSSSASHSKPTTRLWFRSTQPNLSNAWFQSLATEPHSAIELSCRASVHASTRCSAMRQSKLQRLPMLGRMQKQPTQETALHPKT